MELVRRNWGSAKPPTPTEVDQLLAAAYPVAIPEADYLTLCAVLSDIGWSRRHIAYALFAYSGVPYLEFRYAIPEANGGADVSEDEVDRVRALLGPQSLDALAWEPSRRRRSLTSRCS